MTSWSFKKGRPRPCGGRGLWGMSMVVDPPRGATAGGQYPMDFWHIVAHGILAGEIDDHAPAWVDFTKNANLQGTQHGSGQKRQHLDDADVIIDRAQHFSKSVDCLSLRVGCGSQWLLLAHC
uniref:Uncharacterized protein n=1 Tax=Romanomermis culicivorax TaxID=13658 RepID=A0A915HRJ4_ROMCU